MDLTKWIADDPEILGGRVVFVGTRIPVDTLPSLEEVRQAGATRLAGLARLATGELMAVVSKSTKGVMRMKALARRSRCASSPSPTPTWKALSLVRLRPRAEHFP